MIVSLLIKNPAKGYCQVEEYIDNWCLFSTIRRWLIKHKIYYKYAKIVLPLLTNAQKVKNVPFAQRVRNNWNSDRKKNIYGFTLIKKWFYVF